MTQTSRVKVHGLSIDDALYKLVEDDIVSGLDIRADDVWQALADIINDMMATNKDLLKQRDDFQAQLDRWFKDHPQATVSEQASFLRAIGYLLPEGEDFSIEVDKVDPEIARMAGPQLVVPVQNARFALNACNARWGSLYDALYGTDVIPAEAEAAVESSYNPRRGAKVIAYAKAFLDQSAPLIKASYADATGFSVQEGQLVVHSETTETGLQDKAQFVAYTGEPGQPQSILLVNNGLHIDIQLKADHPIGSTDPAHISDVLLEAAVTTIQDFEDSVAAVDAEDKVLVYRNWLGLIQGDLSASFEKNGQPVTRRLEPDRHYTTPDGSTLTLPGRSLLFARNVGLHMFTDAITTADGEAIPEGFLDAMMTALIGKRDLMGLSSLRNSRTGSIYIVKPKLHGPAEVAFTVDLFSRIETALDLAPNTLKMGIMDEERRTTVNLKECIRIAKQRVVFTNTGFLDRTGDDIHTVMEAGAIMPKGDIKNATWIRAYEDWNVDIGLATGMRGKAQIGKGMWAKPDAMKEMVDTKMNHPQAGASTAWVPSPTAATLHAMHYHQVDVDARQAELEGTRRASLNDLLQPALLEHDLNAEAIQQELDNNAQGTLGYVARWIGQGIGCSKVPDINNVGLMEDRATLRISSQHIANWLHHGVLSQEQVINSMKKMALIVDEQNAHDPSYTPMSADFDNSPAFQAALGLVFSGREEANGYTERVLHHWRRIAKGS